MKNEDLGAVVTVAIDGSTGRFALVLDRAKPEPHYWKFPGGKIEREDIDPKHPLDDELTADNAAKRETEEETGVNVQIVQRLEPVHKKTHSLYPRIGLGNFEELAATGDEGEIVKAFSLEQIQALTNFMPAHVQFLEATLEFLGVPA